MGMRVPPPFFPYSSTPRWTQPISPTNVPFIRYVSPVRKLGAFFPRPKIQDAWTSIGRDPTRWVPIPAPRLQAPRPFQNPRPYIQMRGLGSINLDMGKPVSAQAGALQGASMGASVGSMIVPGIGTAIGAAVGAVVGAVVGLLSSKPNTAAHIGAWDSTLVNAFAALPPAAGIGRQIPWNNDSMGLVQMIEALLATGIYMDWDSSLLANYDVCAHWAMALSTAVEAVATAVCKNKVGARVSVSVTSSPGGPWGPGNFVFTNPDLMTGPEAVSEKIIMGNSGLMTWMFSQWQIAGSAQLSKQYAILMGNNAAASKVYALMIDYVAGQLGVADAPAGTPNVTGVPPAVATAVKTLVVSPAPITAKAILSTPNPAQAVVLATQQKLIAEQKLAPTGYTVVSASDGGWWNIKDAAGNDWLWNPANKTATAIIQYGTGLTPAQVAKAKAVVKTPTIPTVVGTTATGKTVTDTDISNLIAALQSSGANQASAVSAALEQLEASGVDTSTPAVQAAVSAAASPGFSTMDWVMVAGGIVAVAFLMRR